MCLSLKNILNEPCHTKVYTLTFYYYHAKSKLCNVVTIFFLHYLIISPQTNRKRLLQVASGRTHNTLATCCETLAAGCSDLHTTHPQQICNCFEYSQQVPSGRLAKTCCHNMLPEFNVATCCGCCESVGNLRYKVLRSMLWETSNTSMVCGRKIDANLLWVSTWGHLKSPPCYKHRWAQLNVD